MVQGEQPRPATIHHAHLLSCVCVCVCVCARAPASTSGCVCERKCKYETQTQTISIYQTDASDLAAKLKVDKTGLTAG